MFDPSNDLIMGPTGDGINVNGTSINFNREVFDFARDVITTTQNVLQFASTEDSTTDINMKCPLTDDEANKGI